MEPMFELTPQKTTHILESHLKVALLVTGYHNQIPLPDKEFHAKTNALLQATTRTTFGTQEMARALEELQGDGLFELHDIKGIRATLIGIYFAEMYLVNSNDRIVQASKATT